ncbi:hypothetical protein DFH07DRAFT_1032755 [Mycena maculata]|uniref:Uncharacterized protein n=1 Tax=Mycena maculata TaxID=230809 RepID=A0AAD7N9A9_9AGAR|nr:hypothetical protein DFH07DRAFT_1032755 [Mycena maculata]
MDREWCWGKEGVEGEDEGRRRERTTNQKMGSVLDQSIITQLLGAQTISYHHQPSPTRSSDPRVDLPQRPTSLRISLYVVGVSVHLHAFLNEDIGKPVNQRFGGAGALKELKLIVVNTFVNRESWSGVIPDISRFADGTPVTQWLWNTRTTPSLPHYLYMLEAIEKRVLAAFLALFICWARTHFPAESSRVIGIWTDICRRVKAGMEERERTLLAYSKTLDESMIRKHQDWTIGLHQLCSRFTWVDDRTVSPVNKILARSIKWNEMQNDGSFLLITTTSDTVRYSRELSVHGKLESVTSSRRANLIRGFNKMSDSSHKDNFVNVTASKTNMVDAPSFFDSGEVAQAILLFDGLGPVVFGEHWEDILDKEGEEATTKDMMDSYRRLPQTLMHVQNLSLKPLTKLISEEKDYLASQREDTVNPLVRYLTEELDAQIPAEESVGGCFDTADLYVLQSGFHSAGPSINGHRNCAEVSSIGSAFPGPMGETSAQFLLQLNLI